MHRDASIAKLVSKEDRWHVHKLLGVLALCSFVYRYAYVYPLTGSLGFEKGTRFDWFCMILHTLVPVSALQFRVPKHRIAHRPLYIYEEYRQHAIVFTLRSFSVFAVSTTWPHAANYLCPVVIMLHHFVVDWITHKHGNGNTAVRAISDKLKISELYKKVSLVYSFYQFLAMGSQLVLPAPARANAGFNTLIAIFSSSFLMTAFKRRIATPTGHLVGYSLCLTLSAYHILTQITLLQITMILATFTMRLQLPKPFCNKYILWTLFTVAHLNLAPAPALDTCRHHAVSSTWA